MLGSIILSSSSSRIIVPSITGLDASTAQSTITSAGLTVGSTSTTSSGANSGNNGTVASQDPASGSDLEFGGAVSYVTYSYTPPSNPPVWTDSSIVNSFTSGSSYSDSVSATNGASYTWEYVNSGNGASPSSYWVQGLTINNSSGAITGTPTTAGQTYSFRIVAYNNGGTIYSSTYSGTVASSGGGGGTSVSVSISSVTSTTISGTVSYDNTLTGASGSISISSSGGSITPSTLVYNGHQTGSTSFTVTGLSPSNTYTISASSSIGNNSANGTTSASSPPPSYTYYFDYDLGTPTPPDGAEVMSSGSKSGGPGYLTVDTGSGCGSQTFYAYTNARWYWICYRVAN